MIKKSNYTDSEKEDLSIKISNKSLEKDLNHPNLVKFKECWMDSINFYFIQEYIEGDELLQYIQNINLTE